MAKKKRRGVRYRLTEGESTPVKAEEDGSDTGLLLAEGLDAAFVGVGRRCGQPEVAVYALEKAVEILVRGGLTMEESIEYLEFNAVGAWLGPTTPIWVESITLRELRERQGW